MSRSLLALAAAVLLAAGCRSTSAAGASPRLVHSVYFTLREDTPATRATLVDACTRILGSIEGVVSIAAGERVEDLTRDVNDLEFDVALHVVFRDRAAHDAYQPHPLHQKFIEENIGNIARVRVFDSLAASR